MGGAGGLGVGGRALHIGAFERAWAGPWRASAQPHNPLIPLAAAFDLTHPSSQPRLDTSQRPQPQYGPVRVASRAQRGPGPPPCLAGPHHSRLKAMRRPGRRHPARASSSAAAGPSWCVQGADANRRRPPGTARVGGRRRGGCSCSRLEAPLHKPCPRCPQAGHPLLPPHALESSLGPWQPDAKRRRVGEVSGGKPCACLHRAPRGLPD